MCSKYIKNEQGWFVCPSCGEVKQNQNTMFYHMKKHEGKLPYECNICKKDFIQKASLELHKLSKHKEKDVVEKCHKCPFDGCKFDSLTKGNLLIHCLRKHFKDEIDEIMDENNSCSSCKNSFRSTGSFYYHASKCIRVNDANKLKILENIS